MTPIIAALAQEPYPLAFIVGAEVYQSSFANPLMYLLPTSDSRTGSVFLETCDAAYSAANKEEAYVSLTFDQ